MKLKLITLFFIFTTIAINAQDSASSILEKAYAKAKAENKNVFLKYSASWCGWCKKMDAQMKSDNCKALFDANYVTVTLTVMESPNNKHLENPGAIDILKEQKGEKAGLPFFVILDSKGKVLEDSFNAKGENLGCPATKEEVDEFVAMLKKTSKLNKKELDVIAETFTKP